MDSNTQKIVQDLNAGWSNYISNQMKLDKNSFQLAQGTLGLQTSDDSGIFLMQDAVPAASSIGYYDSSSMNKRSDAYGMLINSALLPETSIQSFIKAMGSYYNDYINYKKSTPMKAGQTPMDYFKQYENQSIMGPNLAAESALSNLYNSPLGAAQTSFANPSFREQFTEGVQQFTLPVYTGTAAGALSAIQSSGASLTNINFDSSTADSSTSTFFAHGSASGFYEIFSASASVDFSSLNAKAASSSFTITGYINSYATLSCGAGGWYNSAEVKRAIGAPNDFTVWDSTSSAGTWDSFFGQPDGSLARYVSQLILVSDYKLTVTSNATYSQEDYQQIKTHADIGFWPFFSASVDTTQTTDITQNSDSTISATQTLPKGKIQIWGVTVLPQK
ncbi:MAG: hypothetical protein ACXVB0_00135 [Mucilaginibacter sp.]